jgi:hypothetical protein
LARGFRSEIPGSPVRPFPRRRDGGYPFAVSNAAHRDRHGPQGAELLPRDLTEAELVAAPVLVSPDALLIDELTDDEDDAFAAALSS